MPGGRVKLTSLSIVVIALAVFLAACGGGTKHHTWEAEFDERLEGASAAIEASLPELQPDTRETEMFRTGIELGRELEFKGELIEKMSPPAGCEAVWEEGRRKVTGTAQDSYDLYKNLTPFLHRRFATDLREVITELREIEREAAQCATG